MRPWLSGIMSPCQGLVESSILSGRTEKKDPFGSFFESTTTKIPARSCYEYGATRTNELNSDAPSPLSPVKSHECHARPNLWTTKGTSG